MIRESFGGDRNGSGCLRWHRKSVTVPQRAGCLTSTRRSPGSHSTSKKADNHHKGNGDYGVGGHDSLLPNFKVTLQPNSVRRGERAPTSPQLVRPQRSAQRRLSTGRSPDMYGRETNRRVMSPPIVACIACSPVNGRTTGRQMPGSRAGRVPGGRCVAGVSRGAPILIIVLGGTHSVIRATSAPTAILRQFPTGFIRRNWRLF